MIAAVGWSAPAVARVAALITARTGLTFSGERWADLRALLPAPERSFADAASDDRLFGWLSADREAFDRVVSALTVKETYFFRDPGQFRFIARELVPVWRAREHGTARIWSAGCATGEEAYSLAMLCAAERVSAAVIGTDISEDALMIGRGGRYKKWAVRLPESAPALPFLHTEADEHRVNDAIRTRVAFRRHNLAGDESPIGHAGVGTFGFDLVLCRNVLIYLDKTMLPAIVARLHASLAEGGWLITAASDPPLNELAPFDVVVADEGVFYRPAASPRPHAIPPARPRWRPPAPRRRVVASRPRNVDAKVAAAPVADPQTADGHYARALELAEAGRGEEALEAVRRALYLDRSLAMVHFTRGTLMRTLGDRIGARQSFRKARVRCRELPPDAPLPLGDGVTAGYLIELIDEHLRLLKAESDGGR